MHSNSRIAWWVPLILLVIGPIVGVLLGALMNLINGQVSAEYFSIVMWWDPHEVWLAAILQGMLEGGVLGLFFGVVVAISFAASTKFRGRLGLAIRTCFLSMSVVLICWLIGGICGMLMGRFSPWTFTEIVTIAIQAHNLPRFAWVGGSIWGAYGGTAIGALVACIYQHIRWRRERQLNVAFEVLPVGRG